MLEHQIWSVSSNRGILVHLLLAGAQCSLCTQGFVDDAGSCPTSECRLVDITMGEYACDLLSPWERQTQTAPDRRRQHKTDEIQGIAICEVGRSRAAPDTSQSVASQGLHNPTVSCLRLLVFARGRMHNRGVLVHLACPFNAIASLLRALDSFRHVQLHR